MKLGALKWAALLGVPLASCDWQFFNFGRFSSCNWRGRIRGLVSIFHVKDARALATDENTGHMRVDGRLVNYPALCAPATLARGKRRVTIRRRRAKGW